MHSSNGLQRIPADRFGRRPHFTFAEPMARAAAMPLSDDLRLFATTFLAGLLFMTIYLG